ncbi:MAG: hypothetical protein FWE49_05850 [Synergistaceae bacterium]|nr:hypothetical protein [Synergistaceae bacterium]
MAGLNDWSIMIFWVGGLVLAYMIYIPALKDINPFSGSSAGRYGLNDLIGSYQKARDERTVMRLAPLLIFPGLFFARDPNSFFACLALIIFGSVLMKRSYSADRILSADYRKEAEYLVIGSDKNALALLERLDKEVRHSEAIIQSGNDYYLFPSAIVVDKKGIAARPWIVPTDIISYMHYHMEAVHHFVYLYDERKRGLCAVRTRNQKDASELMSKLTQRFGVQSITLTKQQL